MRLRARVRSETPVYPQGDINQPLSEFHGGFLHAHVRRNYNKSVSSLLCAHSDGENTRSVSLFTMRVTLWLPPPSRSDSSCHRARENYRTGCTLTELPKSVLILMAYHVGESAWVFHTHAHLHVNSGESVWWGKCVCMYMCVHQSEPVAISPPVCARSLSFTLTHLSAPACPHHRRNPIRLKIMTRGTVAHRLSQLLMALFLFETFSPPVVPSCVFFPLRVLTFVTEFVKRCCRFMGWQKATEWAGGLMGCVIFVYLSVCGIRQWAGMLHC